LRQEAGAKEVVEGDPTAELSIRRGFTGLLLSKGDFAIEF
jgi:hypothetical protein